MKVQKGHDIFLHEARKVAFLPLVIGEGLEDAAVVPELCQDNLVFGDHKGAGCVSVILRLSTKSSNQFER